MMADETLNLERTDILPIGASRIKERVVVSKEWFERLISFYAGLQLMADGYWFDKNTNTMLPPNLYLKQLMIDCEFDQWSKIMGELLAEE